MDNLFWTIVFANMMTIGIVSVLALLILIRHDSLPDDPRKPTAGMTLLFLPAMLTVAFGVAHVFLTVIPYALGILVVLWQRM
jgi:hypothetical protein